MPCLQGLESQAQDKFPSETETLALANVLWLLKWPPATQTKVEPQPLLFTTNYRCSSTLR